MRSIMRYLLIVESPAKTRTISKLLKTIDPLNDYEVVPSFGHIRDLKPKELSIDLDTSSFTPSYVLIKDVTELKKALKRVDKVLVASDPDREGESIAWHLVQVLKLTHKKYARVTFNAISERAIKEALSKPRKLDMDLVNAQQARRAIDRITGFKLSPLLWTRFEGTGLSAGRVQSACLKLIVDKEASIIAHWDKPTSSSWKLRMLGSVDGKTINAILKGGKGMCLDDAHSFLKRIVGDFQITETCINDKKVNPPLPFTTSTLQQEAYIQLRLPIKTTMQLAQTLYESGYITYMRTDSHELSDEAQAAISKYVCTKYGAEELTSRSYSGENHGHAQEAHEAIRPTRFDDAVHTEIKKVLGEMHARLYDLIMCRVIASQMNPAVYLHCTISIKDSSMKDEKFVGELVALKYAGWKTVYGHNEDDCEFFRNDILHERCLKVTRIEAEQVSKAPQSRYTDSTIVKALDEFGLGRPSTYTSILTKLIDKGYIKTGVTISGKLFETTDLIWNPSNKTIKEKRRKRMVGGEKDRLQPTTLGVQVCEFLTGSFPDIVSYEFTHHMETMLDEIALGKATYESVVGEFWYKLKALLTKPQHRLISSQTEVKDIKIRQAKFGPVVEVYPKDGGKKRFIGLNAFMTASGKKRLCDVSDTEARFLASLPIHLPHAPDFMLSYGKFGFYVTHQESGITASVACRTPSEFLLMNEVDIKERVAGPRNSNHHL